MGSFLNKPFFLNRNYLDLLWLMTEKEFKLRYKNTVVGFFWILIIPLIQMLVVGFVFRFFINEIDNYFLFLLVGLMIWNFFSNSVLRTTLSIVNERNLIKKSNFPREIIPLSIIFSNLLNLLISLGILIVFVVLTGTVSISSFTKFIVGLFGLLIFTIGLSLITSSLNVRFRDVSFLVQAVLSIWFYATPIIYSLNQIPDKLMWFWFFNPLTSIVQLLQSALVATSGPELMMLLYNLLIIILTAVIGIILFNKESKNFDDWI